MWTRNTGLLIGSGIAVAIAAFLGGRRVESETAKGDVRSVASAPVAVVAPERSAAGSSGVAAPLMPLGNPAATADLFTRLQAERDGRPTIEPNADSVFAAMKKLGIEIEERLQVAAFVVGARFCDKVRTKNDVHVVVCEYADEPSAIKGAVYGQNDAIKNREVLRNKSATCAIHQTDDNIGAAEATQIKGLFNAM